VGDAGCFSHAGRNSLDCRLSPSSEPASPTQEPDDHLVSTKVNGVKNDEQSLIAPAMARADIQG
jgi:hypothetical protein